MTLQENAGFRLSPQQRLSWRAGLPQPEITLAIKGQVNVVQLRLRLAALVRRHEILRLQLQESAGFRVPLQYILDEETAVQRIQISEGVTSDTPLTTDTISMIGATISAHLIQQAEGHYQLRLQLPALSADRGTLLKLAQAILSSEPENPIDPDEMTYSQYTAWLYELQADEDAKAGHHYWSDSLARCGQDGDLLYKEPVYRAAATTASPVTRYTHTINSAFNQAISTYCHNHGCSASDVLMTAWAVLLQRLSTRIDSDTPCINLNWLHDCRADYEELDPCWGMFSKALPLAWTQPLDSNFNTALAQLQVLQESAVEWQEYYAIETEPEQQHSRYGFDGSLCTATAASPAARVANVTGTNGVAVINIDAQTQLFELLLAPEATLDSDGTSTHSKDTAGYRLQLTYDAACYSEQAAIILLEQYQSLLVDALRDPLKPLQSLSLNSKSFDSVLARGETSQPLQEVDREELFAAAFSRRAQQLPSAIALYGHDQQGKESILSYDDLERRSNRLAHHLMALGMGAESRVALYLDRSTDLVVAMIAVLKSGAAFLPLETQLPGARIQAVLTAAQPALILSSETLTAPSYKDVGVLNIEAPGDFPATPTPVNPEPHHAAYILFTSGSTGTPKGVVIEQRQLYHYVTSILARVSLEPYTKSALVTSLAADLSYTLLFPALLSGGELHVVDRATAMDPDAWAAYQAHHQIDHIKAVPSLLDAWLNHSEPAAVLPRKQLILGGESCAPALLKNIRTHGPDLTVYNHYGPTETTVGVLMHKTDPAVTYRQLPLSNRLDHVHIRLMDGDREVRIPGLAAELYIGGPQLARGYLNKAQTEERFIVAADGVRLYRTGDLARYRVDGALEIVGRADRQVKIRGFRIELDEIQVLLAGLPFIRQAAVEAIPNSQGDLQLFAFVSLSGDQQISVTQVRARLQEQLPDYMLPNIRLVDALPLMANGKLDRPTLREWAGKMLDHICSAPPRTPLEELLVGLWADVLGIEKIGIDDDFFRLGGHSLAAVKLASRLQKALATTVPVNAIFAAPSVAAFVTLLQSELQLSPLVELSPEVNSARPILFCFHSSNGHVQDYQPLVQQLPDWQLVGIQAAYLAESDIDSTDTTIDSLAAAYLQHLRTRQPNGPYYLLGWSLGGLLALTVAAQLEQVGEKIGFLGIVDSQTALEAEDSPELMLASATQELDSASQQQMGDLSPLERHDLLALLAATTPEKQLFSLSQWAQERGMKLAADSWKNMELRLQHHYHTQRLLASFRAPPLVTPLNIWWAKATLESVGKLPVDWQTLTLAQITMEIIDAEHMTILHRPELSQQLDNYLGNALETQRHTTAAPNHSRIDHASDINPVTEEII